MAAEDLFSTYQGGLESPASNAVSASLQNSGELGYVTRALYVGVAGDVKVEMAGGGSATFRADNFQLLPIRVKQVYATGTTGQSIIALW